MNINLGSKTDLQALQEVVELQEKQVVDVGCGNADFAAELAGLGADVTGIEPDPVQAKKNRHVTPVTGLTLIEAGAEALPLEDASQDLLIFRFSLHHIPHSLYPAVFKEAARVLRPGGQLYTMEPLVEGSSQYVMELFHDETVVRARAQEALRELTPAFFDHSASYRYEVLRHYDDFAAYVKRYGKMSYNDYALEQIDSPAIKSRFMEFAQDDGRYELTQPVKADLFQVRTSVSQGD